MDLARERSAVERLPASGRLRDMHRRLALRLERAGLDGSACAPVLEANASSLLHRLDALRDEEHFELLHPSRTLLILLDDCGVFDADVLCAAVGVDSEHAALHVPATGEPERSVPVPASSDDRLLEELIVATPEVRLIALAERLDHARHLHLREPSAWPGFHASVGDVYLPVAHRTHPRLARRYDWWWRMFGRRFLAAPSGS